MKLLLALQFNSQLAYESVFSDVSKRTNQQYRKFMDLFTQGLVESGVNVEVVSGFAVNPDNCSERIVKRKDDVCAGVNFHYLLSIRNRHIDRVLKLFQMLHYVYKTCKSCQDIFIIADPNQTSACVGVSIGAKLAKRKLIFHYTDLPSIHTGGVGKKKSIRQKIADRLTTFADGFIFTTEAMADALRIKNKPYMVMEGTVDSKMGLFEDCLEQKYANRVVMYTGGVVKHYGLENFIMAFNKADIINTSLYIFGGGPYEQELKRLCDQQKNVHYFGVIPNSLVVQEQRKATLLVNPRPSGHDYTKYSFPIKNHEYLVSGTAMLSTRLSGMPEEYYQHMFLFDDESVDGMSSKLVEVLSHADEELFLFGQRAKKWVLCKKNNISQMKLVRDFIRSI